MSATIRMEFRHPSSTTAYRVRTAAALAAGIGVFSIPVYVGCLLAFDHATASTVAIACLAWVAWVKYEFKEQDRDVASRATILDGETIITFEDRKPVIISLVELRGAGVFTSSETGDRPNLNLYHLLPGGKLKRTRIDLPMSIEERGWPDESAVAVGIRDAVHQVRARRIADISNPPEFAPIRTPPDPGDGEESPFVRLDSDRLQIRCSDGVLHELSLNSLTRVSMESVQIDNSVSRYDIRRKMLIERTGAERLVVDLTAFTSPDEAQILIECASCGFRA